MAKDGHEQSIGNKGTGVKQKRTHESHLWEGRSYQLTLNHLGLNIARDEGIHSDLELTKLLGEGGREA